MWLSLVERYVRDVEVASSNLVISTKKEQRQTPRFFFACMCYVLTRDFYAPNNQCSTIERYAWSTSAAGG